jgi:hypothetical protein
MTKTLIRNWVRIGTVIAAILFCGCATALCPAAGRSDWVYFGSDGKLAYRALPNGDHIMDFSHAGYRGGGVVIPDVSVKATVSAGGNDSENIQHAIDQVSGMSLIDGHRGTVLLSSGTFNCDRTLEIEASGIVLRGSDGTALNLTGQPHWAIHVHGHETVTPEGRPTEIADPYVPSGTDSFNVGSATGLQVGDTIQITKPVTDAWVHFMDMDTLTRNSKRQHWLQGHLEIQRVISKISGNRITVGVPLSDNYDSAYLNPPGPTAVKVQISGLISETGIEHLRIESPPQAINIGNPQFQAIQLEGVTDSWLRDVDVHDTIDSIEFGNGASRITLERVNITHSVATVGAASPADFGGTGTQILLDRCGGSGNHLFYFATMGRTQGPNVLLNCVFHGNGSIQPHQRWSTGLLVDSCRIPDSGIELMNRGEMGSGHGWTMGWGVLWNCIAKSYVIQQPPGSMNWAIGCVGKPETLSRPFDNEPKLPQGTFDSPGEQVAPKSLYLEQLRERLGDEAVRNIGY